MSITSSTYKPLFIIFHVLYKKRSVVREAYIHTLYDLRQDSKFYSEDSLSSIFIFFAMLCYYFVIIDKTSTLYLISAFSIKLIAKPTLF